MATTLKLEEYDLPQLKALERDVQLAIESYEKRKVQAALDELDELVKRHGVSLDQVLEARPQRKRAPSVAKYANPDDPNVTWTGRGRKPLWVISALESGKTLESLSI